MRLSDLDPNAGILGSPSPQESLDLGELLHVPPGRPVLTDVETTVGVDQHAGQVRMAVQKESIAHEHQLRIRPRLASQANVLNEPRIERRLTTKEGKSAGAKST